MENILRVSLAQINTTVGDLQGNLQKIKEYAGRAAGLKADIVVFPELALCGYPPEDLLLKESFVKNTMAALDSLVEETRDIIAIVGFVDMDKHKNVYNAAGIVYKAGLAGVYRKMFLPNYGVFDEKRYFSAGKNNFVFKTAGISWGVSICEDVWVEEGPYLSQASAGAKMLINISSSPYYAGKGRIREELLQQCARNTKTFVCYVNMVGGQDELVFDGGSLVVEPEGRIIASGEQFAEDLITVDLDMRQVPSRRRRTPGQNGVKTVMLSGREIPSEKPPFAQRQVKKMDPIEEIYRALVLGTADYVRKNNFQKTVIGLSGGIDSAFTARIACDAIGKGNVIGVSMPSKYSSQETQSDAEVLARNLGMRFIKIPIDSIFQVYLMALEKEFLGRNRDVTEENLQARIRGNLLMALSNKFGWLVLTTGNKSETSVGYCTLYGDMAGGFAVIKDVPKTLVYDLARWRNRDDGKEIIPESIFTREPTAELRHNQKDTDSLPSYPVLDPILKLYVEENRGFEEINAQIGDAELIKRIMGMVDRNEYKRRQAPPGVKITPLAFGRDRRFPITNRYREFVH